jgi:hypothetical protein
VRSFIIRILSASITRVIKSRRRRLSGNVACKGAMRNACYNVLVKPAGGGKFERLEGIGDENIKMDIKCVRMWARFICPRTGTGRDTCGNVNHCRIQ